MVVDPITHLHHPRLMLTNALTKSPDGTTLEVFLPAKEAAKLLWPGSGLRTNAREFHSYMEHFDFVAPKGKVPTDKALSLDAARSDAKHGWV